MCYNVPRMEIQRISKLKGEQSIWDLFQQSLVQLAVLQVVHLTQDLVQQEMCWQISGRNLFTVILFRMTLLWLRVESRFQASHLTPRVRTMSSLTVAVS